MKVTGLCVLMLLAAIVAWAGCAQRPVASPGPEPAPVQAQERPDNKPVNPPERVDLLTRGAGTVSVRVSDAAGAALNPARFDTFLYRVLGSYSLVEQRDTRTDDNVARYAGVVGEGLEPGQYQYEFHGRLYGSIIHRFTLGRGEHVSLDFKTPYSRRVICLRFMDEAGNPIPAIGGQPSYMPGDIDLPYTLGEKIPSNVLRQPLSEVQGSFGGGRGGRGDLGGFARRRSEPTKYYTATDDGRLYTVVFAGPQGHLSIKLDAEVWGKDRHSISSTFDGPEWDEFTITLPVAPGLDEWMQSREVGNGTDPGNQHLTRVAPGPFDASEVPEGMCRVILTLDASPRLTPVVATQADGEKTKALLTWPQKRMHKADGRWYFDVPRGEEFSLSYIDGCMFVQEAERILAPDAPLHELERVVSSAEVTTPTWPLPRTVDAWATERFLLIGDRWSGHDGRTMFLFPAWISVPMDAAVLTGGSLGGWMQSGGPVLTTWELRGPIAQNRYGQFASELEEVPAAELWSAITTGTLSPPSLPHGFACRFVGDHGEGLPWVAGVLMPAEHEAAAQEVLAAERAMAAEGVQWRPENVPKGYFNQLRDARAAGDDAAAEALLPESMRGRLGTLDAKLHAAQHGAWYDEDALSTRMRGDAHGYFVSLDTELTPGSEYVLYLWSNSRDDLNPDARITFTATDGVTDLGVVRLPSYR